MNSYPLISAEGLLAIRNLPQVKVFDVRGNWSESTENARQHYLEGHIEGAFFLDWKTRFVSRGYPLNLAPVSTETEAAEDFRLSGINRGDMVVLYDCLLYTSPSPRDS